MIVLVDSEGSAPEREGVFDDDFDATPPTVDVPDEEPVKEERPARRRALA